MLHKITQLGSELQAFQWDEYDVEGLALDGYAFDGVEAVDCVFNRCRFEQVKWQQCLLRDCVFKNCAFLLSDWFGLSLTNVKFLDCKLMGMTLEESAFGKNPLTKFSFHGCKFGSTTFSQLNFSEFEFSSCRFEDGLFQHCKLHGADFSCAEFIRTPFVCCDLENANFQKTRGLELDPRQNHIFKAQFTTAAAMDLLTPLGIAITDDDTV